MLLENWILNFQDLQPHANLFLPLISPDQLQQTPRPPFTVVRQNCQNLFSKIVTSFNPQLCHGNLCLDSLRFKYRTELDSRCSLYHWEIFMSNVLWQSVTTHYCGSWYIFVLFQDVLLWRCLPRSFQMSHWLGDSWPSTVSLHQVSIFLKSFVAIVGKILTPFAALMSRFVEASWPTSSAGNFFKDLSFGNFHLLWQWGACWFK